MRVSTDIMVALKRTTPSDFRRTLRIIPKEPFPMTSRGSYASMKDVDDIKQRMGVHCLTNEYRTSFKGFNHHVIASKLQY